MEEWILRVDGILRLVRGGLLLLIEHARIDHMRTMLEALEPTFGEVAICLEPWELEALPEGALVVFVPAAEHAAELNAARPLFADRKLRVLLWCKRGVSGELARKAPDFFDWISHRVECPGGLTMFFEEGLRIAREVGVGGVIAVWPSANIGDVPVGTFMPDSLDVEDLRTVPMAEARIAWVLEDSKRLPIVVKDKPFHEPGWWTLAAEPIRGVRLDAARTSGARQQVWLRGEDEAISLAQQIVERERGRSSKSESFIRSATRLLYLALRHNLVSEDDLILGRAPAPLLRAAFVTAEQRRKRSPQRWTGAARAPAGWRAVFAPDLLRALSSEREEGLARLEVTLRRGGFAGLLADQSALRALQNISDDSARIKIAYLIAEAADPKSPLNILLARAQELVAIEDYQAAASLMDLSPLTFPEEEAVIGLVFFETRTRLLSLTGRYKSGTQLTPAGDQSWRVALREKAPSACISLESELGLNAARAAQRLELFYARRTVELIAREHLSVDPDELPEAIALRASIAWLDGCLTDVERELARSGARALGATAIALLANVRWLQGRPREGLDVLAASIAGRPPLPVRIDLTLARARCAVDAGQAEDALVWLHELMTDVARGLGPHCHVAAQIHLVSGDAHLTLGRYQQARASYHQSIAILRTDEYREHPDRFQSELALTLVPPGNKSIVDATRAFDALSTRLTPKHPLVLRWRARCPW